MDWFGFRFGSKGTGLGTRLDNNSCRGNHQQYYIRKVYTIYFTAPVSKRRVTQPLVDMLREIALERGLTDLQLAGEVLR